MGLARCQLVIQDDDGNIVNNASVTVTLESSGALGAPYSDFAAATPLGNPYVAADGADAGFHAVGGMYRIDAVLGALTRTWRYVAIGTAAATDGIVGTVREVSGAGTITVGPTDLEILVNKTVGAATTVDLGLSAARGGASIIIKDLKRDADLNNITPVFSGGELCEGLAAASFVITTPGGFVQFKPRPDGTGWYLGPSQL